MWNSLRQQSLAAGRLLLHNPRRGQHRAIIRGTAVASSCNLHHHRPRPRRLSVSNKNNNVAAAITSYSSDRRSVVTMLQAEIDEDEIEKEKLRDAAIREALDRKTGRLWSDPWDLEDMLNSKLTYEDLPEWSPKHVSRISQERVKIYPDKIPKLSELAGLALPPPPPPHPGLDFGRAYALHRKRAQYMHVLDQVKALAQPRIGPIRDLEDWQARQDAVDQLFEEIEFELKEKETVLGKHPKFGSWVERALEEHLRSIQQDKDNEQGQSDAVAVEDNDTAAVPIFMDCFNPNEDTEEEAGPKILHPLVSEKDPNKETERRMVEEWELSAHKTSRRIMLRQCTRRIAQIIEDCSNNYKNSQQQPAAARIFVCGRQGVGKTAALAAIVASARKSGSIVLYLPYGDQFHQNGFYIEPNGHREGIFDLPILSQQVCEQLLESHENDLKDFEADKATLEKFFTADQLELLSEKGGSTGGGNDGMKVVALLQFGTKRTSFAAMCYAAAIDVLMGQEKVPFIMVLDEFNCYYAPGHYYHAAYDEDVKDSIPYNEISLFKPALDAMAISVDTEDDLGDENNSTVQAPVCMKRGAILVATTESHAIARKVTDGLLSNVKMQQESSSNASTSTPSMHLIEVPRLSILEVEHTLANYEATGVGKLRLDRGETVMNAQEVAFLRMVSGGIAQKLLDASIA